MVYTPQEVSERLKIGDSFISKILKKEMSFMVKKRRMNGISKPIKTWMKQVSF